MRAKTDGACLYGKTRADFEALEKSIHEYGTIGISTPPATTTTASTAQDNLTSNSPPIPDVLAIDGMTNFTNRGDSISAIQGEESDAITNFGWDHSWPLWGVQESVPFAIGGFPFNVNMDFPT